MTNRTRKTGMSHGMITVPSGTFMMGSPADEPGRYRSEGPQHRVTISRPFAVGKYPVTVGQFASFVAATGHDAGNHWRDPPPAGFAQTDAHPVVSVSWDDAKAYVNWLSARSGQQYRLLTEAEWEYVARAGTTTAYHFGETISPSQANYKRTVEVGSYPANAFGLHDVHGNVWEWVEDCWHNNYNGAPSDGSAWTSDCDEPWKRVLRGGSCDLGVFPRHLRSARRGWGWGNEVIIEESFDLESHYYRRIKWRFQYNGFRIARTV